MLTRREFNHAFVPTALLARQLIANDQSSTFRGSLVLYGGGKPQNEDVQDRFWNMAGGKQARLVVIPTAHEHMDSPSLASVRSTLLRSSWEKRGVSQLTMLHARARREADETPFLASLETATGVWLGGGDQRRLLETYRDTKLHHQLQAFLRRGGVIGGSSAGTAVQSQHTISTNDAGEIALEPGFNFWPGTIVDQHFLARNRQQRLRAAIATEPDCIGLGIDEFTALVVTGDQLEVIGKSVVTVVRRIASSKAMREMILTPGKIYEISSIV